MNNLRFLLKNSSEGNILGTTATMAWTKKSNIIVYFNDS